MDVLEVCFGMIVVLLLNFSGVLTLSFCPQTKHTIRYENFVVVFHSSGLNVKVHITRKHINIFSNTAINLTSCITESFLISFNVFLNVYSPIYNVLEIIQNSFLGSKQCTRHISYYSRSCRGLQTEN